MSWRFWTKGSLNEFFTKVFIEQPRLYRVFKIQIFILGRSCMNCNGRYETYVFHPPFFRKGLSSLFNAYCIMHPCLHNWSKGLRPLRILHSFGTTGKTGNKFKFWIFLNMSEMLKSPTKNRKKASAFFTNVFWCTILS